MKDKFQYLISEKYETIQEFKWHCPHCGQMVYIRVPSDNKFFEDENKYLREQNQQLRIQLSALLMHPALKTGLH